MTTRKTITAILAAIITISVCCSCAAQTANSSIPEASSVPETAVTTAQTTPTPQETKKPLAETAQTTTTAKPETKAPETAATTTAAQTTPKPQETKASETAAVTTAIQTTPAPEWTESKASGTKYVNTSCYSRKKAVLGAETVKLYSVNEKVTVTAKTNTGYFKLSDGSFIHGDYLSDSKVVIQTTTTTAKEQETPKADNVQTFTVLTIREDVPFYSDINCTNATSWAPSKGFECTVVEVYDSKNCYKLSNGEYVKMSDVEKGKLSDIYRYPFDLDAIKKVIVDDAVKNYGLVLAEDIIKDESSWNAPLVIWKSVNPNVVRMRVLEEAGANFKVAQMKKGDYFNVYIETIPDLKKDENGNSIEGYAIFFLR